MVSSNGPVSYPYIAKWPIWTWLIWKVQRVVLLQDYIMVAKAKSLTIWERGKDMDSRLTTNSHSLL